MTKTEHAIVVAEELTRGCFHFGDSTMNSPRWTHAVVRGNQCIRLAGGAVPENRLGFFSTQESFK